MKFKFQSFVDVSTSAESLQVLQWSVGGKEVLKRCMHLFGAFKYFKLGKISVKMVPAATLPVDPLKLSYDDGDEQTIDPRDQMNKGLVRITNGEDIFTDVSSLTDEQQWNMYYSMLLDPRWSKFGLQSGFRRSAYPLYWQVGQLHQDRFPGATRNLPQSDVVPDTSDYIVHSVATAHDSYHYLGAGSFGVDTLVSTDKSSPRGLFQVGHRGKLGYLPTDYYQEMILNGWDVDKDYGINDIPEVQVITCVLPRAYKTVYRYRIYITEEVYFAGIRAAPLGALGIDNFTFSYPVPFAPGASLPAMNQIRNDGGDLP